MTPLGATLALALLADAPPKPVEHRLGFALQVRFDPTALPVRHDYARALHHYGRGGLVGPPAFEFRSSHALHPRIEVGSRAAYAFAIETRSQETKDHALDRAHMHVPQLGAILRVQDKKVGGAFGLELELGAWIPVLVYRGRGVATITPYIAPSAAFHIPTRSPQIRVRLALGYAFRLVPAVLHRKYAWRIGGVVLAVGADFGPIRVRRAR